MYGFGWGCGCGCACSRGLDRARAQLCYGVRTQGSGLKALDIQCHGERAWNPYVQGYKSKERFAVSQAVGDGRRHPGEGFLQEASHTCTHTHSHTQKHTHLCRTRKAGNGPLHVAVTQAVGDGGGKRAGAVLPRGEASMFSIQKHVAQLHGCGGAVLKHGPEKKSQNGEGWRMPSVGKEAVKYYYRKSNL